MKIFRLLGVPAIALITLGALTSPAFGADNGSGSTTSAGVTAGDRNATLAGDISFPAVAASHADQSAVVQHTSIDVSDLSATQAGWDVTVIASDLTRTGGGTMAAANVSLDSFGALTATNGATTGITPGTVGAIDSARTLLSATTTNGDGDYAQAFDLGLNVPGDSLAGAYTGTLTVTIAPPS